MGEHVPLVHQIQAILAERRTDLQSDEGIQQVAQEIISLSSIANQAPIHINGLSLFPDRREITIDKQPKRLAFKEFKLLYFLATHPQQWFSQDELLKQVWTNEYVEKDTVRVHICYIKNRIAPYDHYIQSRPRVGYVFDNTSCKHPR